MQSVGERIEYKGFRGTVLYRGILHHTPARGEVVPGEIWVGVEWDISERGAHNGTVDGTFYFVTSDGTPRGSLLRERIVDYGAEFIVGWSRKYISSTELSQLDGDVNDLAAYLHRIKITEQLLPLSVELDNENFVLTTNSYKMIECIGFDRVWERLKNLKTFTTLSLAEGRVNGLGPEGRLRELFPALEKLSLEGNLLRHWEEVFRLANEFPLLRELNLNDNSLLASEDLLPIFPALQELSLKQTCMTWAQLQRFRGCFPVLEELVLADNDLSDWDALCLQPDDFPRLRKLDLSRVGLKSTRQLTGLMNLPLDVLNLSGNALQELSPDSVLTRLTALNISSNSFEKLNLLADLTKLHLLASLRFLPNPLSTGIDARHIRCVVLGGCSRLQMLNGSEISRAERRDSEIYYLNNAFSEFFKARSVTPQDYNAEEFERWSIACYPSLPRLIERYGNPYPIEERLLPVQADIQSSLCPHKRRFLMVIFRQRGADTTELRKKFPRSVDVGYLVTFIKNVFRTGRKCDLVLWYRGAEIRLEDTMRRLEDYTEEDEVFIEWE